MMGPREIDVGESSDSVVARYHLLWSFYYKRWCFSYAAPLLWGFQRKPNHYRDPF
jgi:hypothetical protein